LGASAGTMTTMPWVVAHRGASDEFAEHTPAAIQRALDLGADGIECDVRLTSDGHVVLMHDATTKRTAGTQQRISRSTLAQLRELDYGAWHHTSATDDDVSMSSAQRHSLMTLPELLQVLEAQPRPVGLFVETKHPSRNGKSLEPYVARVLAHFGWNRSRAEGEPPVSVMSFSQAALRRLQSADAAIPRTLLVSPPLASGRATSIEKLADSVGPSVALMRRNADWISRAVASHRPVFVWTVDTDADFDAASRLGVTAIITNRPRWAVGRRDAAV